MRPARFPDTIAGKVSGVDFRHWRFSDLTLWYQRWLDGLPLSDDLRTLTARVVGLFFILLVARLSQLVVGIYLGRLRRRMEGEPRDGPPSTLALLFRSGALVNRPRLIPGIVAALLVPLVFGSDPWMRDILWVVIGVYMALVVTLALYGVLNFIYERYRRFEDHGHFALKTLIQAAKVVLLVCCTLVVLAIVFRESPLVVLSGLGAVTAVFLLIFKDALLGLVAGVQLNVNNMVELGDWIQLPDGSANGTVVDIALTTIKVQNFDNTISCIPAYTLISSTFINWRGMSDSGGRRIRRAMNLDLRSIRLLEDEEIAGLRKITLLSDFLDRKVREIAAFNAAHSEGPAHPGNSRRLTNAGVFRIYCENYLRSRADIQEEGFTFLVRQLEPGPAGLPLQLYVFTRTTDWNEYEAIQADVFEHLIAVLPLFGLAIFQSPSGKDLEMLGPLRGEETTRTATG